MALPIFDTWAPAQFVFQQQSQVPNLLTTQPAQPMNNSNSNYDSTVSWKIAGTIILALIVVFVLQQLGFRFVVGANVTTGMGR